MNPSIDAEYFFEFTHLIIVDSISTYKDYRDTFFFYHNLEIIAFTFLYES